MKQYRILMYVDGAWWPYGTYSDANRANEIAMQIRDEREVDVWVKEVD